MTVWAIADLHLAFGCPEKNMGLLNPFWKDYEEKIASAWNKEIKNNDLVLIPGDISWAMRLEDAAPDFKWIDNLPGTKLLLKGNHDYWWGAVNRVRKAMPPTLHVLQNDVFLWNGIAIGGSRLWDTPEYSFGRFVNKIENPKERKDLAKDVSEDEKIFQRELLRLEMSLKQIPETFKERIAMTHYPPIGADLAPSRASHFFEKYRINTVVFGHLHNIAEKNLFGEKNGVRYILTSADYLDFAPTPIL